MKKRRAAAAEQRLLTEIGIPPETAAEALLLGFERGEALFREGMPAAYFMLVIKGRAKVTVSVPSGRRLLVSLCEQGTVLGIVELPLGIDASSSVTAIEPVVCVALPMERCRRAMDESPDFARRVARMLAEIVARSSRQAAVNALSSLRGRLCAYIANTRRGAEFSDHYTRLAEALGVSARHLFRALAGLCAQGILEKTAAGYRIADEEALLALAEGCALTR